MVENVKPILVIGGGAAGILAAWKAALEGAPVILLERNPKLGIKILISGGGKCNITHAGTVDDLLSAFLPGEARFLKPSFHTFPGTEILRLLAGAGVQTETRPDGRIFPLGGNAHDVMRALEQSCHSAGVMVRTGTLVTGLESASGILTGVRISSGTLACSAVVLATGGVSYRKTGTTGDGIRWAGELGHTIVPLRPALAPLIIEPPLPPAWRGIAIRDGRLNATVHGRLLASWNGDILFTHEGLSGPAALELSRPVAAAAERDPVQLEFDFFPHREFAELDTDVTELLRGTPGKMLGNSLHAWLPNRMVNDLLRSAGLQPDVRCHSLTRDARRRLTTFLKSWRIGRVSHVPLDRGEVSAGGVSLREVDPQTMRSRKIRRLYLCGELLDIAGPVGGYNLQAAFSTGYTAGMAAASDWHRESSGRAGC